MNKIFAVDNFKTKNWILDISQIGPYYNDLFIGFTNQDPITSFKNLEFGFELKKNEDIKSYAIFPPEGIKYIQTDQQYLESIRL